MKRYATASPLRSISGTPSSRTLWSLLSACAFAVVALLAVTSPADAACSNEAFRTGTASQLPDCRAYEQVSPIVKTGEVSYGPNGATASPMIPSPAAPNGNLVTYSSFNSFADNPAAPMVSQYLAARDATGWSTEGISPPKLAPWAGLDTKTGYVGFGPDLLNLAVVNFAAPGQMALFRRNPDGSLTTIADGVGGTQPTFLGATPDFSHVLVVQAETGTRLWLWKDGQLTRISGEGGTPPTGSAGSSNGIGSGNWGRPISDDGSRVYWTPSSSSAPMWLYENGAHVSYTASQCTTGKVGEPGPGGNCAPPGVPVGGNFWTSTTDGEGFFTSGSELTNASLPGTNLYRYGTDGQLTDLTAGHDDPNGARVEGVLGASDDGSYVYFVARGVLADGAVDGQLNLYAWNEGETTFAGILTAATQADSQNWLKNASPLQHSTRTQVSADGNDLIFTSTAPTSQLVPGSTYDNAGFMQVYLFDPDAGEVFCISCDPSGAAATGTAALGQSRVVPAVFATYRNLSADGSRVYFETPDGLLPQDVNGVSDVYQWQRAGTGSCASGAPSGGCVSLISTGRSAEPSFYQSMSASGDDVFFLTREQLVGQDTDELNDLYDARVGGGLLGQHPPTPTPPCLGEACRGPGSGAGSPLAPGSAQFTGGGNAPPDCSSFAARARQLKGDAKDLRERAGLLRRLAARTEGARSARSLRGRAAHLTATARGHDKRAQGLSKRAKQCRAANGGVAK